MGIRQRRVQMKTIDDGTKKCTTCTYCMLHNNKEKERSQEGGGDRTKSKTQNFPFYDQMLMIQRFVEKTTKCPVALFPGDSNEREVAKKRTKCRRRRWEIGVNNFALSKKKTSHTSGHRSNNLDGLLWEIVLLVAGALSVWKCWKEEEQADSGSLAPPGTWGVSRHRSSSRPKGGGGP